MENLESCIEAILFAVGRSVSIKEFKEVLGVNQSEVESALEKLEEKVAIQEQNLQILSESHHNLNEAFNNLGLSVVDGKLHITYEGGENPNE